jgi:hypothetical protein
MKQGSGNGGPVSYGKSARGTWMKGSFTGCPEEYVQEGSGNGHLSPVRGPWRGGCCTGDFERNVRLFYQILFIRDSKKYVKEGPGNRRLSP